MRGVYSGAGCIDAPLLERIDKVEAAFSTDESLGNVGQKILQRYSGLQERGPQ